MSNRLDSLSGVKYNRTKNATSSELEIAAGNVTGITSVNKFGRAGNTTAGGVQTTATDIWDRADAVPTQQIWVAPTEARAHTIVSSSASDDGAPVGIGARTVRVYGLTDWATAEVNEDVTLNGTGGVVLANEYVAIHRMEVLTSGATSINVGTIKVTAATDTSITAVILPGQGQTQMAIYAWPSTQTAYMAGYYASMNESTGAATSVNISVKYNAQPDSQELNVNFRTIHTQALSKTGASYFFHQFRPYVQLAGPGIVKIQGLGSGANLDISAGFDLILVDN